MEGRGLSCSAEGRRHPWQPALHDATSLTQFFTPQFFDAVPPPGLTEWGPWAVCSMARPTPGIEAGTVSGLREFTQTKGPRVLQRTKTEPSSHR